MILLYFMLIWFILSRSNFILVLFALELILLSLNLFFISANFISEDIHGYFRPLKKRVLAFRYKSLFLFHCYLFFCSFKTRKNTFNSSFSEKLSLLSIPTFLPFTKSRRRLVLARGMHRSTSSLSTKLIKSPEEIQALKYLDYIKLFFTNMPNKVDYYSKDDFVPFVNMCNWLCTESENITKFFSKNCDKIDFKLLREAYIKGAGLDSQKSAAFFDSAHFSQKKDSFRLSDFIVGVQTFLDIKTQKDESLIHPIAYGAQLKDSSGKVLMPDALKENGTIVDCCKANPILISSYHQDKELKYTQYTSLKYETLNISYASSPLSQKLPISNLVQAVYPQILPPEMPNSFPFPVSSSLVNQAYPHIHPLQSSFYQEYKQEVKLKFGSFVDFDSSNMK
jgi:hypothetical protein